MRVTSHPSAADFSLPIGQKVLIFISCNYIATARSQGGVWLDQAT